MAVIAVAVRLPDFQHRIGDRRSRAIHNLPFDENTFAPRIVVHQNVEIFSGEQPVMEKGSHSLAGCLHQFHPQTTFVSNGVIRLPLSVMLKRYPSAHSGVVMSCAYSEISN